MQASPPSPPSTIDNRVLVYAGEYGLDAAVQATRAHPRSGLVFCGSQVPSRTMAELHRHPGPLVLDSGSWKTRTAHRDDPFGLCDGGSLFSLSLGEWAAGVSAAFSVVLTPSGFVPCGAWPELEAIIQAADDVSDPRLVTFVPTDAAVLDRPERFVDTVRRSRRRLAFLFASDAAPLATTPRAGSLRDLLTEVPGAMVIGCEPITALDCLTHGAVAAGVGVSSTMRRPARPGDGDVRFATRFLPGMFLRDLWEQRSPATYADWYLDHPQPTCARCPEPRSFESFEPTTEDKGLILRHNIHGWLGVLEELCELDPVAAGGWLADERALALDRHLALRPFAPLREFDALLREYARLDGRLPAELSRRRR